jgi:pimeloyl-ACP methyl ester carboxylesterase
MSPSVPGALKIAGGSLIAVGTVAAGAAIGLAVQRRVVARNMHSDVDWCLPTFTPQVHEFVTADGTALHVEIDEPQGITAPITVLLCHGYALSSASLIFQRAVLEDRARVISYDQRSHGKSERSQVAFDAVDRLGEDLSELIAAFAPTGPLMLVGHSMGGMTIMALAEQRPELFHDRVKAITFIATTAGGLTEVTFGMPAVMRTLVHRAAPAMASALAKTKGIVEVSRRAGGDLSAVSYTHLRAHETG